MTLAQRGLLKFGHTIQLAGAVYAGEGNQIFFLPFPDEEDLVTTLEGDPSLMEPIKMTQDDWVALLRQTDFLETEVLAQAADKTVTKAIIRKSTRQIEQGVSWSVFHRDNYRCRYCGKGEGLPLTVDHLVTWESGGPSTVENLVSACRKCNKIRGDLPYAEWLRHPHYLQVSKGLSALVRADNEELLATLDKIPRRVHQRSR